MLVGYARTSTFDQAAGFEAQVVELTRYGCDRLFQEQVSSVAHREQLDQALSFVRKGDVLVVTKLDRLARSVRHLWQIIESLQAKGVGLRILNMALDTNTATGKLMVSLLGAVAEFEREMLLERQRVGIERAKREGKYRGRKPTARARINEMRDLRAQGLGASAIAQRLSVSRASVYRLLKTHIVARSHMS